MDDTLLAQQGIESCSSLISIIADKNLFTFQIELNHDSRKTSIQIGLAEQTWSIAFMNQNSSIEGCSLLYSVNILCF